MPAYRERSNSESCKAEQVFLQFVTKGFSYDEVSNHPDYTVYASDEMLAFMLPLIIDEMLLRNDTQNYLVYPILTAIDPALKISSEIYNERFREMVPLITESTTAKICALLAVIWDDPPDSIEQLERISTYWKCGLPPTY